MITFYKNTDFEAYKIALKIIENEGSCYNLHCGRCPFPCKEDPSLMKLLMNGIHVGKLRSDESEEMKKAARKFVEFMNESKKMPKQICINVKYELFDSNTEDNCHSCCFYAGEGSYGVVFRVCTDREIAMCGTNKSFKIINERLINDRPS